MTESVRNYQKLLCEYIDAQAERDREIVRLRAALRNACPFCADNFGKMMPPHNASKNCESGKRNHCTCDVCF